MVIFSYLASPCFLKIQHFSSLVCWALFIVLLTFPYLFPSDVSDEALNPESGLICSWKELCLPSVIPPKVGITLWTLHKTKIYVNANLLPNRVFPLSKSFSLLSKSFTRSRLGRLIDCVPSVFGIVTIGAFKYCRPFLWPFGQFLLSYQPCGQFLLSYQPCGQLLLSCQPCGLVHFYCQSNHMVNIYGHANLLADFTIMQHFWASIHKRALPGFRLKFVIFSHFSHITF